MDCMARTLTNEAARVAWSVMPCTVASVEQRTIGQDQGKLALQRLT